MLGQPSSSMFKPPYSKDGQSPLLRLAGELARAENTEQMAVCIHKAAQALVPYIRVSVASYHKVTGLLSWADESDDFSDNDTAINEAIQGFFRDQEGSRGHVVARLQLVGKATDDQGGFEYCVMPIRDAEGGCLAVLRTSKEGQPNSYTDLELSDLRAIAAQVGLWLAAVERREGILHASTLSLYRQEALLAVETLRGGPSELLQLPPLWLQHGHYVVIMAILIAVTFVCCARIHEKAAGPVVIQAVNRIDVFAATSGTVGAVVMSTGQSVLASDLLMRISESSGQTLMEKIQNEVRAPAGGIIGDILVWQGEHVVAGQRLATLVNKDPKLKIIALMPGAYAPQIRVGMPLLLKVRGYPDSLEAAKIQYVSPELVSSEEAMRYIGTQTAGSIDISGSVLILHAELPGHVFEADGRQYTYQDGMVADAEMVVKRDPLIFSLLPNLKYWLRSPRRSVLYTLFK